MTCARRGWIVAIAIVLLSPAPASAWRAVVVNDEHPNGDSVTVVDTETDEPGDPVPVGVTPFGAAVTPDARTAWVSNFGNAQGAVPSVQPVDLIAEPPVSGTAIPAGDAARNPAGMAITPDGTAAYAPAGTALLKIDLTRDPPVLTPIEIGRNVIFIAITPDGRTAYLTSEATDAVVPVDLGSATPGDAIAVGDRPRGIAVTPDGAEALVAVNGDDVVKVIDLATGEVAGGDPIPVPGANEIAIAPDGATAWVTTWNGVDESATQAEDGFLVPVDVAAREAGDPVDVKVGGVGQAWGVAITPDGRRAYVSDGRVNPAGTTVRPVDLTTSPATPGEAITVGPSPRWIAITPDQAPTAAFNVTAAPPGEETRFDASSTLSASSPAARFDWDFGDGARATTRAPDASHSYAAAGTYDVTLTVTTAGGTSTEQVFTGQTLSRNGGASAATIRSVAVTPRPAPAVALDPPAVDFGRARVGQAVDRRLVVRNVGAAPLDIGSVTAGGDFALTDNGCDVVAPGGRCEVGVRFTARAPGPRADLLRIESDAPGSPHTAALSGTGDDRVVLTGIVRDSAGAPLPGTLVETCLLPRGPCGRTSAGADGRYRIEQLVGGLHQLRAFPPTNVVESATQPLTLAVGEERSHDVVLRRLPTLSGGVSLVTPSGTFTSGRPSVWFGDPLTYRFPVDGLPEEAAPGTRYLVEHAVEMTSGGFTETWEQASFVEYGDDRRVANVTSATAAPGRAVAARALRAPVARVASHCGDLGSRMDDAQADLEAAEYQPLQLLFLGFGHLRYELTVKAYEEQAAEYAELYEQYEALGCDHDEEEGKRRDPKFPPTGPVEVKSTTTVTKQPNGSAQSQTRTVGNHIDPSGTVRTTRGAPVEDATVTLEGRPLGSTVPFAAVPDGSDVMSPRNQRNPDRTDRLGRFGWDVLAGTYRVLASHRACRGVASTRELDVPPPRLGLRLRLRCPGLRRAPTRMRLRFGRGRQGAVLLRARVRPRGRRARRAGRPAGTVAFRSAGATLARVPVDPRTGRAVSLVQVRRGSRVRARYPGDARFAPAARRRRRR